MKGTLVNVSRALAGVLSAALVGRFGMPVLAAMGFLAVLGIAAVCWIINSKERAMNLSRILIARRGDVRCLDPPAPALNRKRRASARQARNTPSPAHPPGP